MVVSIDAYGCMNTIMRFAIHNTVQTIIPKIVNCTIIISKYKYTTEIYKILKNEIAYPNRQNIQNFEK